MFNYQIKCLKIYHDIHFCLYWKKNLLTSNPVLMCVNVYLPVRKSNKDLGERVGPSAGDEGLRGVEGHVMNGLIVFFPVCCDLLHTRAIVQHPQAHRAVMTWEKQNKRYRLLAPFTFAWEWSVDVDVFGRLQMACCFVRWCHTLHVRVNLLTAGDEVSAFRVCGKTGYSIQVSHHGMDHFPCSHSERK